MSTLVGTWLPHTGEQRLFVDKQTPGKVTPYPGGPCHSPHINVTGEGDSHVWYPDTLQTHTILPSILPSQDCIS